MCEPAKMVGSLRGSLADDRHVQAAADHAGDVAERHALFGDPMIARFRGTLLKREPVETGSIEPVHRGPAVEPVANLGRVALFLRDPDEVRGDGEIVIAVK